MTDLVNHPAHYTSHPSGVECIEITEHMGFNLGNVVKYVWRADLKDDALADLHKARFYIDREIAKREDAERSEFGFEFYDAAAPLGSDLDDDLDDGCECDGCTEGEVATVSPVLVFNGFSEPSDTTARLLNEYFNRVFG